MIALIAGLMTSVAVVWCASIVQQDHARVLSLGVSVPPQRRKLKLLEQVGWFVLKRFTTNTKMAKPIGLIVLFAPVLAMRSWLVATVFVVGVLVYPLVAERRRRMQWQRLVDRDLPTFADLLSLAVQSGHSLRSGVEFVSGNSDGAIAAVFKSQLLALDQGRRLIDVIEVCRTELGSGPGIDHFISIMLSAENYGAPIVKLLTQYSQDIRFQQQNRAERTARQLSVQLLFPVAGCVLPAFALLTAAPLLAGSIGTLASSIH